MLHGMFVADTQNGLGPAATLRRMNRQLAARSSGGLIAVTRPRGSRFATLFYGILSPEGRLVYANAGHTPPVLLSRGAVRRLGSGGPILGAFPDASFEDGETRLEEGDTLLMFSDGVTEARNDRDEEFGEQRLLDCASQYFAEAPADILDGALRAVRAFVGSMPQSDDITLAVTRFQRALEVDGRDFADSSSTSGDSGGRSALMFLSGARVVRRIDMDRVRRTVARK
jgi:phosphoserine phosphatase RsbU/P